MTTDNTLLVQAQIAPEHEQVVVYTFKIRPAPTRSCASSSAASATTRCSPQIEVTQ